MAEQYPAASQAVHKLGRAGAGGKPFNRHEAYLSHYYRFRALALGPDLQWDRRVGALRKGDAIRPPAVYDVPPPPERGYGPAAPAEIRRLNERFNGCYTAMVHALEDCWSGGGEKAFLRALELMFELRPIAQAMMRSPRPDGRGYCPTFEMIASERDHVTG